jgi:hypothetical protein
MDLEDKGCEGTDWIHLTQDKDQFLALLNTVMNFQVHWKAETIFTVSITMWDNIKIDLNEL